MDGKEGRGRVYGRGEGADGGDFVYLVLSPHDGTPMYAFDGLAEAHDVADALADAAAAEGFAAREYRVFMVKRWGK